MFLGQGLTIDDSHSHRQVTHVNRVARACHNDFIQSPGLFGSLATSNTMRLHRIILRLTERGRR